MSRLPRDDRWQDGLQDDGIRGQEAPDSAGDAPAGVGGGGGGSRVIKRYANRKLYDTGRGRFTSLAGIRALVTAGVEVSVLDHATGVDVTRDLLGAAWRAGHHPRHHSPARTPQVSGASAVSAGRSASDHVGDAGHRDGGSGEQRRAIPAVGLLAELIRSPERASRLVAEARAQLRTDIDPTATGGHGARDTSAAGRAGRAGRAADELEEIARLRGQVQQLAAALDELLARALPVVTSREGTPRRADAGRSPGRGA